MARNFYGLFGKEKVVIGMIHLAGMGRIDKINRALREIETYEREGLAGAIVEDYHGDLGDVEAALKAIKGNTRLKIGVNALRNTRLAFEFAHDYGAKFVQIDSVQTNDLDVRGYEELREKYPDIVVLGGVRFKYTRLTGNKLEKDLVEAMPRCEAIVTTGEGTGKETPLGKLEEFRQSLNWLGGFPLISGAGVNYGNIRAQLGVADGIIIGSYFKNGNTRAEIIRANVGQLMGKIRGKT